MAGPSAMIAADIEATGALDPVRGKTRFGIVSPYMFGAVGDGVADDSDALVNCVALAAATGIAIDLGSGRFRITKPIATLLSTPISIVGDGPRQCQIIVDRSMAGDVLSFRDTWYGAEMVETNDAGATVTGNPIVGFGWPSIAARVDGVVLRGFKIVGKRGTLNVQNGIMFYGRNDHVSIEHIDIHFIRGIGLGLSGFAVNLSVNAATLLRESNIIDVHVRWCGDSTTARPSVVMNSSSKRKTQSGWEFDDANNYNRVAIKVVFSDGLSFQCNDYSFNTNHMANNRYEIIVDSQRGPLANPANISGGAIPAANWSVTNGVLNVSTGGSFVKNTGVGQGDLTVGTYVYSATIPPGTYVSQINSGPATDGAGVYQLAHPLFDLSAYSVAQAGANGTLRLFTPCVEIGGGHGKEVWEIIDNGSNVLGSNSVGVAFNQMPLQLHTDAPKMGSGSTMRFAVGRRDIGMVFTSISQLDVEMPSSQATVAITSSNVTGAVTVNTLHVANGKSGELQINGSMERIHVRPGMQQIISGTDITTVMTANKWPNCVMLLNNAGTLSRWASLPQSPQFNTCVWTAA